MRVQGVQGQGCPQHESTQPGPLTLLLRKTRVRHRKQAQVQTVSKTSLRCRGGPDGPGRGCPSNSRGSGFGVQDLRGCKGGSGVQGCL